jgi:hypothetical protein
MVLHHYNSSDLSPANFFEEKKVFSLPKGKRATGQHHPDPEHIQRQLGTGHQDYIHLKGQCHEIFDPRFFSSKHPSWAPD